MNNIFINLLELTERTLKAYRMPKGYKAEKPKLNIINAETLQEQADSLITQYCNKYNIDIYDYSKRSNIKHNEVNNILRFIYINLFKPKTGLMNNQKSLLDYDDMNQLQSAVDVFINICMMFNKSLGLWSFSIFTGIDDNTIIRWMSDEGKKSNPTRWEILKNVKEYNKAALISNLKDSPVGALAVANNDIETGLQWATNQAIVNGQQAVFLIPSERLNRLGVGASEPVALPVMAEQEKAKS